MSQQRALVTGGAGFLGSHLCDALLGEGYSVIAVDNLLTGRLSNLEHLKNDSRFEFRQLDINQPFDCGKVDYVFHFASPASPVDYTVHGVETLMVGSLGSFHALDVARKYGAKYLVSSTSECYGDPLEHPQKETYWGHVNPVGPRSVYDEAKRFSEAVTMAYHRYYKVDTRIVRIFNTYGPRMHPNDGRVVSNFIVQALKGEPLTIYGDGGQTRAFCYVDDLIEGFLRLMAAPDDVTGPINLGNPVETTVGELAEKIIKMVGSRSTIERRPLPVDDPVQRCPDISRARDVLEWAPRVPLDIGLDRTIAYFDRLLSEAGEKRSAVLHLQA
jgi:nucleoside-diphosphate-sugar epimerase